MKEVRIFSKNILLKVVTLIYDFPNLKFATEGDLQKLW